MRRFVPFLLLAYLFIVGCADKYVHQMEVTAYCGCGKCCGWERGSWKYLKLDFWNRYINSGKYKGQPYSGLTASGTKPREPHPGLISVDSIAHPWMIPIRLIFFPWLFMPHDGTIAADTKYYYFGTRMHIPGYGWGVVEDRGSAIKGPHRIDVYFDSHKKALAWGRKRLNVKIER
jgi:3D (Asp-Asp-Asp) domain-containing protein